MVCSVFFFVKQKTAYEMRISDWSSDVCSSDLHRDAGALCDIAIDDRSPQSGASARHQCHFTFEFHAESPCCARTRSRMLFEKSASRACSMAARASTNRDRKSVVSGQSLFLRYTLGCHMIFKKKQTYIKY